MKKRNNQGFAISTILYGLVIMAMLIVVLLMSLMSSNRRNTSGFVDSIEEELNRYSQTSTDFSNPGSTEIGDGQEYIVPYGKAGWYKIELWGAAGNNVNNTTNGGKGAYTSGIIYLEENTHLYFYIGEAGQGSCTPYSTCMDTPFNGGGMGGYFTNSSSLTNHRYGSGGGATDVRLVSGDWNDATSLNSRIMVAAGGGSTDEINNGSSGGTLIGIAGDTEQYGAVAGTGGGQTAGGTSSKYAGSFGIGGEGFIPNSTRACCNDAFGAGGGYYGGGGGYSGDPSHCQTPCVIRGYSGGGSSYISGYAGVNSITSETDRSPSNQTIHYSGKYFIDGLMVPGVNNGSGKASIELISTNGPDNPPTKRNSKLSNVRYIRDCVNGNTVNAFNHWTELQAIVNGTNVAKGKIDSTAGKSSYVSDGIMDTTQYSEKTSGNQCLTIDLGTLQNLDEIAVWHYFITDNRQYYDHTLSVSSDNATWVSLKSTSSESGNGNTARASERETATGFHYSAWQPDSTAELPDGNYYIFSTLAENRVLTAQDSKTLASGSANVTLELFNATNLQTWTIKKVDDTYYSIIETENNHSLQVSDGTGDPNVNVNAAGTYEAKDWELWRIIPLGNGNYRLQPKTSVLGNTESYLSTSENSFNTSSNILLRQKNYELSQRFRFVNAEF